MLSALGGLLAAVGVIVMVLSAFALVLVRLDEKSKEKKEDRGTFEP